MVASNSMMFLPRLMVKLYVYLNAKLWRIVGYYMGLSGHFRTPVALVFEETAPHYTLDSKLNRFQRQSKHGGEKKTSSQAYNLTPIPASSACILVTVLTELHSRNY